MTSPPPFSSLSDRRYFTNERGHQNSALLFPHWVSLIKCVCVLSGREGGDKVAVAATRLWLSWSGTNPPLQTSQSRFVHQSSRSRPVWKTDFTGGRRRRRRGRKEWMKQTNRNNSRWFFPIATWHTYCTQDGQTLFIHTNTDRAFFTLIKIESTQIEV